MDVNRQTVPHFRSCILKSTLTGYGKDHKYGSDKNLNGGRFMWKKRIECSVEDDAEIFPEGVDKIGCAVGKERERLITFYVYLWRPIKKEIQFFL